ncbi:DUF4248 domain-containing protein [Bacteroides sp. 51]|uniref:DUF4248 domain-containing protein n=1 Tax=Bacteroides sp. 51 TaxID=2302938 RepID=UPI0013D1FE1A|nr:DUF4248 domain-containing protein [Bacteroides sp. 51]NDV84276.1 DUF4248 domain-containing protein [Bacteroides sp. 51]
MKEDKFVIKAYLKVELARLYNPHMSDEGALRKMRRWINHQPQLKARMDSLQLSPSDRQYTPKQVRLIVEYLGEPFDTI